MTKTRVPDSFEEAALEVVRALSAAEAARIVGLSPQTLRDYTDADRPGRPTLQTALELDVACFERLGRAPFFESYSRQLAARTRDNQRPVGDVLVEALDLPGAVGRLLDLIRRSRSNGKGGQPISPAESNAIMKAIKVQRRELDDVEAAVTAATKEKSPSSSSSASPASPSDPNRADPNRAEARHD